MSMVDLIMPKLGESIMETTILKWHKKPGDKVELDETVLDIATDKVDSEVPSTATGILSEILYNENDVVPIGKVIARIKTNENYSENNSYQKNTNQQHEEAEVMEEVPYQPEERKSMNTGTSGIRLY